jgi:inorganic pyrophosphatase
MEFWEKLDKILISHEIIIDRPKGTTHPKHSEIVYPFDCGYLKGTSGGDGNEIDICRGTRSDNELVAVICTVDSLKQDAEMKLLVGCTDNEMILINQFYNSNSMSGIIVKRPVL